MSENNTNIKNKVINIAFSCNRKWLFALDNALWSIVNSAEKDERFVVYVLSSDIEAKQIMKLNNKYSSICTIYLIKIDNQLLSNLPTKTVKKIGIETYYRYLLPDLIPENKILYLDVDVLVRKSLWNLYTTDISSYYCAGVEDLGSMGKDKLRFSLKNYVNAGVLLINLEAWKEDNVKDRLIDTTHQLFLKGELFWHDQDSLNVCLKGKIKSIDAHFNCLAGSIMFNSDIWNIVGESYDDPVIMHYNTPLKPWNSFSCGPFLDEYTKIMKSQHQYWAILKRYVWHIKFEIQKLKYLSSVFFKP